MSRLPSLPFEPVTDWPEKKLAGGEHRFDYGEIVDAVKSGLWVRVPRSILATSHNIQTNLAYHGLTTEARSTLTHVYVRKFPREERS